MIASYDLIRCSCRGRVKVISALLRLTTRFNSFCIAAVVGCGICSGNFVTLRRCKLLGIMLLIYDPLRHVTSTLEAYTDININISTDISILVFANVQ